MRPLLAAFAVLAVACAPPAPEVPPAAPSASPFAGPPPSSPPPPSPPPPSSPPPTAPAADVGPPPRPPMAMRWAFHQPEVAGRGSTTQRLAVLEDGSATWESEGTAGDGDLDEALGSRPGAGPAPVTCRGHLGPRLHRGLVEAARRAMALGCTARAPRLVDEATTSLAVTWEGDVKSCTVPRSGGGYVAFERVRAEAIAALCPRR